MEQYINCTMKLYMYIVKFMKGMLHGYAMVLSLLCMVTVAWLLVTVAWLLLHGYSDHFSGK